MPLPGNLKLTGQRQGKIEGSCDIKGREGTILIEAFDHCVQVPTDKYGSPAGKRVHSGMTLTKHIDKSTPKLYQVLCGGEMLTQVELDWYDLDGTGKEVLYYKVCMHNCYITKIRPWIPNVLDSAKDRFGHMEDVSLIYARIQWVWVADGIEFEDELIPEGG